MRSNYLPVMSVLLSLHIAPAHAADANPALTHNDYVTLSGTITGIVSGDEFEMDYGTGTIRVDTNDTWPELFKDAPAGASRLKKGDRVTVTGRVDKNWLTANEIEADYLSFGGDNYTMTYRNPRNRDFLGPASRGGYFSEGGRLSVTGTVTHVKNDHEFVLQYPGGLVHVDTDGIALPKATPIAVGEQVTVYGTFDKGFTEKKELLAQGIDRSNYFTRAGK
jgi:uncharacterized protein YdeI (BOF family)